MVHTSGIRERFRSSALKELAKERGLKRSLKSAIDNQETEEQQDGQVSDDEAITESRSNQERRLKRAREAKCSLLSILPEPKNASSFGATIRLDKLLKMPERVDNADLQSQHDQDGAAVRSTGDGVVEVDMSRVVGDVSTSTSTLKEITIERSRADSVILPQGKAKQKNQITYLAQLSKATELERKEQAAQSRQNKAAARSKYGW